jgi:HSP20 family protein
MAIELRKPRLGLNRFPFRELTQIDREMEDLFGRFFGSEPRLRQGVELLEWSPAIDVIDRKEELLLRADLPGLTEKDIEITVEEGTLRLRGQRTEEKETKEEDYCYAERWSGSFSRVMRLPAGIDAEKVDATFKNGVLEVHLPKTKEATGKKIAVKAA